jgi:transcription initiation factor IIE alpha subunit
MDRFKVYVARREFRLGAVHILEHVLQRGEMPRGEASRITGLKERSARELLATLLLDGIVGSETPKGPVSLRFSTDAVEILFPNLFPQT